MGKRVGFRRSDRRWLDEEGQEWDSRFEWEVYDGLKQLGVDVEKVDRGCDSIVYSERKPNVLCTSCGSTECIQERSYTPDLRVYTGRGSLRRSLCFIEVKGYFPKDKRSLFRSLRESRPDVSLCFIAKADLWVTKGKTRLSDYFGKYLKDVPFYVWGNKGLGVDDIPKEWLQ